MDKVFLIEVQVTDSDGTSWVPMYKPYYTNLEAYKAQARHTKNLPNHKVRVSRYIRDMEDV